MTISRETLLRLVQAWASDDPPPVGVLLDALTMYGIDVDGNRTGDEGLTIREHVDRVLCSWHSGQRQQCSAIKYLFSVLQ